MNQGRTASSASKGNGRAKSFHASKSYENIKDSAKQSKEKSKELFSEGKKKLSQVERELEIYVREVSKKVQKNPIASVLIAGGVGYILSALFRRK